MNLLLKQRLEPADYMIILMNLVPLAGVWFFNWDPRQIFLIYCIESILTGIFTIVKMGIFPFLGSLDFWKEQKKNRYAITLGLILFFIVHFGIFLFVQLMLFFGTSNLVDTQNPVNALLSLPSLLNDYSKILFLLFAGIYAVQMIIEFILKKGYQRTSPVQLMFAPYARIFIQQFVVILGGTLLSFGAGKLFMLLFVIVKVVIEVKVNYDGYLNEISSKWNEQKTSGQQ